MVKPQRLQELTRQGALSLLHSFAALRFYPPQFLEAISVKLLQHMEEGPAFTAHELAIGVYSYGKLAHHPGPNMMAAACAQMDELVRDQPTSNFPCFDQEHMYSNHAY